MSDRSRSPVPLQRIGVATELPGLLADMGVDPASLFADHGFDPTDFGPARMVPFQALLRLINGAVAATGCAHLGVLCGLRFTLAHHGPLGRLMATAQTIGQALDAFVRFQPAYSSSAIVYLHRRGTALAFGYASYAGAGEATRPLYEAVLAVALRMLHELSGLRVYPVEFHLNHRPPKDPALYARLLGAPVRFNQAESCLILDEAMLTIPLLGADPSAHAATRVALQQAGRWGDHDWTGRVRHELRRSLFTTQPSMAAIAAEIGIGERSLRRRLDDEGATFEALRDEVRLAVARELLELTDLPIGEIAAVLRFASPGVFSEAFQRGLGLTPSAWRRGESLPTAANGT